MAEKLTDEERALLTNAMLVLGSKALRIIDAHAADRAALVLELEERRKVDLDAQRYYKRAEEAEARVRELTRERDEARKDRDFFDRERQNVVAEVEALASERSALAVQVEMARAKVEQAVARYREERAAREVYEARVRELTRERDEARKDRDFFDCERQNVVESLSVTEAEVTRLTRERDEVRAESVHLRDVLDGQQNRAFAAESEVTRLTEALAAAVRPNGWRKDCEASEARVLSLSSLLKQHGIEHGE